MQTLNRTNLKVEMCAVAFEMAMIPHFNEKVMERRGIKLGLTHQGSGKVIQVTVNQYRNFVRQYGLELARQIDKAGGWENGEVGSFPF